ERDSIAHNHSSLHPKSEQNQGPRSDTGAPDTHHSHLEEVLTSIRNLVWEKLETPCINAQSFFLREMNPWRAFHGREKPRPETVKVLNRSGLHLSLTP